MEQVVDVVKVGKVRIDFQNPVWLGQNNGPNVDETDLAREEWLALHPRDDIVHTPADIKEDGCC
jgi:hypothetical protein